VSCKFNLER